MTAPGLDACACGCGAKPVDGVYWAFETCLRRWIAQQRREPPAPVRAFCGSTYTETPASEIMDDIVRLAASIPPPMMDVQAPIKLTAWQKAQLLTMYPPQEGHPFRFAGQLGHLSGRPIELVDTEADSDLPEFVPEQACEPGAEFPQVAPEQPQVTFGDRPGPVAGWLGRMFGKDQP